MVTQAAKSDATKPRRLRWFQYRLRSLLAVVLIDALICSWLATRRELQRREREAVRAALVEMVAAGNLHYLKMTLPDLRTVPIEVFADGRFSIATCRVNMTDRTFSIPVSGPGFIGHYAGTLTPGRDGKWEAKITSAMETHPPPNDRRQTAIRSPAA